MSIFSPCPKLVALVVALAAAVVAAEEACSEPGRCAAAADALVGSKAGESPVNLLQLKAAEGGKGEAAPAAKRRKSMSSAHHRRDNVTFGRVFGKEGSVCEKTVGSCMFSECDASRASECHSGVCACPDYMCNDGTGKCVLSASEIVGALEHGISQSNINEEVTSLANSLPGVADSISSVTDILSGVANSVSTVFGAVTGMQSGCSTMVSTCMFSDCPESVSMTATCSYGVCSCKENFCYNWLAETAYCVVDLNKLMGYDD